MLCSCVLYVCFFFFKQKTAYEMRISDWSSDVCSSDLTLQVAVIDPVADYADLLERLFDFDAISTLLRRTDFRFRFDAMHAVTGPYARRLLVDRMGAPAAAVINAVPLEDFRSEEHTSDIQSLMPI